MNMYAYVSGYMYVVVPIWHGRMMGLESWWCRATSPYVTEPVDVVLVVTGGVLYVVVWAAACMYGVVVVVGAGGIIYDSVDGSG
jgi:hypothetical protein